MSNLKKISVEALAKKVFLDNKIILIEQDLNKKRQILNELAIYLTKEYSNLFVLRWLIH